MNVPPASLPDFPIGPEHRRLLDHPPVFLTFRGTDLFERIGAQPTVDRLVDLLYEGISDDDRLRPLFPRDLAAGRSMQKLFFAEWLGGPRGYSEQAHAGLKHSHDGLPITPALASLWLGHFRRAMEATIPVRSGRTGCRRRILFSRSGGGWANCSKLV